MSRCASTPGYRLSSLRDEPDGLEVRPAVVVLAVSLLRCTRRFLLLFLLLVVGLCACGAGERGVAATEGILNFGRVNERVCRGAQPDAAGLQNLKRLGVGSIINLRRTNGACKAEEAQARANGMAYTNVPLSGIRRPAPEKVAKVLALIETLPAPVFIHCQHGCDRTGTIIACYRIRHDRWSAEAALQEAARYGMSKLARGMRRFVSDFAKGCAEAGSGRRRTE